MVYFFPMPRTLPAGMYELSRHSTSRARSRICLPAARSLRSYDPMPCKPAFAKARNIASM
jgi:hypothetical protein